MSDTVETDLGPLEDIDLSEDQDDTTVDTEVETAEEETEDTPASEETEESEATDEVQEDEETEGEAETEVEADTEETDPEEASKEAARQAYQRRQEARLQRQNAFEQVKQQEIESMREQGADDQELAIRQLQLANYQNTVTNNSDRLTNQFEQAKSIDTFKSDDPVTKKFFDDAIDEFEARYVDMDELGNPINIKGNLYEFLNNKASLLEDYKAQLARSVSQETKKNFAKQKAAVTPKPTTRRTETVDPYLDAFNEEANR